MAETKEESDDLLRHKSRRSESKSVFGKWWSQEFSHQEYCSGILESWLFRLLIIFLVIADTALVITEIMLDSLKIHHECKHKPRDPHFPKEQHEKKMHRIETLMEVAHFLSIGILAFFVLELLVRLYVSGREFWNIRKKKMVYFDAFIVITSLVIDLYCLRLDAELIGNELILLFSFRLWRFVRIISSVAEGIRDRQEKHKEVLNKAYLTAISRLLEVLKHKTDRLESHQEEVRAVLEQYQIIDQRCQASFKDLNENRVFTSSYLVTQFIDDLNGIEHRTNESVAELLMMKPTTVSV